MAALPRGTFRAGERTGPLRDTVTYHRVAPFLLDATEVTVAAYGACVEAGRCTPAAGTVRSEDIRRSERAERSSHCNQARADRAEHPVNCVDWAQARAYCEWAGKRLPSEAEWEWAARNGAAGTPFPWGDEPPGTRICWRGGAAEGGAAPGTCPVGSHPEGDTAGIADLAGNVAEWTSSADEIGADSRGRGGTTVRIARGGGFLDADAWRVSATVRLAALPWERRDDLGFRCARSR
jgi:formylglycine-generating enzyme required for sulfatase activity